MESMPEGMQGADAGGVFGRCYNVDKKELIPLCHPANFIS